MTGGRDPITLDVMIIGAGPSALMAADYLAHTGRRVVLMEGKASPARKFLMAGKSGLNLTMDEPLEAFLAAYGPSAAPLAPMIRAFGPEEVIRFTRDTLGQPIFTGSSRRVFPKAMKASPMLRAWLQRLGGQGVEIWRNFTWDGWGPDGAFRFSTAEGPREITATTTLLALGGASWPNLGGRGEWLEYLSARGVETVPFQPMNMGFHIKWSDHMRPHFGHPLKSLIFRAGEKSVAGEIVITAKGIEGGGVYALSREMREGAMLSLDLCPDRSLDDVAARLKKGGRRKDSLSNILRKSLGIDGAKRAVLFEMCKSLPTEPKALAERIKALPIPHSGPFGLDRAISSSGGVAWSALDDTLQLRALPNVYCIGEMVDWDAPTGGYLLTACFATGLWAARAAA